MQPFTVDMHNNHTLLSQQNYGTCLHIHQLVRVSRCVFVTENCTTYDNYVRCQQIIMELLYFSKNSAPKKLFSLLLNI